MTAALTSLTYVVGKATGPTDVVLLAFPSRDQAVEALTGVGLIVGEDGTIQHARLKDNNTIGLYDLLEVDEWDTFDQADGLPKPENFDEAVKVRQALFTDGEHDNSHGGIDHLELVEVPVGKPVIAFYLP